MGMGCDQARGVEVMRIWVRRMKTIRDLVVGMCHMYVQVKVVEMGMKTVYIQVMKVGSVLANGVEMGVKTVCAQVMKVGCVQVR